VVYWDQRGNGLSERIGAEEISPEAMVEEIDAVRDRFSPGAPVTLVGHSFGAMYTALYASRRPEAVAQAVLVEPGGLNDAIFRETYGDTVNIDLLSAGMTDRMWGNRTLSADDHEEMDYRALLVLLDDAQMNYWCDPEAAPEWPLWRPGAYLELERSTAMLRDGFEFAEGLREWPVPVLILGTECSSIGYDFQVEYTAPLFADAEVAFVPDAGHRLFVEQPLFILDVLRGYLEGYSAPRERRR
jgi:proline iminopeptidase